MDIGSDYYLSWSLYYLAVATSNVLFWRLLLGIGSLHVKILLQLTLLALLITPASLEPGQGYLVPAFMVMIMEGLNEGFAAITPRFLPMVAVLFVLIFVTYLIRWVWRRFVATKFAAR
ncbi:MAG: hypothetical protein V7459_05405 [Oceanicoccus sp.]